MTVKELIIELEKLPQDANVWHLWDGELRTEINVVFLGKGGDVVTADYGMVAYSNDGRPFNAPDEKEDLYWQTPSIDV